jgi:hypothetical protein
MFASQVRETVTLPDGVNTAVVKKLSFKSLEDAAQERQRKATAQSVAIGKGFAEFQREVQKSLKADAEATEALKTLLEKNPISQYDRMTLLERGIVSWTLTETPTTDEIADLDEETATLLVARIWSLSRPKTQEERKND